MFVEFFVGGVVELSLFTIMSLFVFLLFLLAPLAQFNNSTETISVEDKWQNIKKTLTSPKKKKSKILLWLWAYLGTFLFLTFLWLLFFKYQSIFEALLYYFKK